MKYERNFIVEQLPDIQDWEKCIIKQWFIKESIPKIRFRLYDDGRFYVDSGDSSEKGNYDNYKFILDRMKYEKITRFKYRFESYFISIDILEDNNMIFEIESKDKSIIDNFIPYDWLGEEI